MEELLRCLREYGRFLELEDNIPYWESQLPELRVRIRELEINRDSKEIALKALDNPGFFRRLLGGVEEKKEKLGIQLREASAALAGAQWEQKLLQDKLGKAKQELELLGNAREEYLRRKQDTALSTIEESQLILEELAVFTPVAIQAADRVLEALADARPWMQKDAMSSRVGEDNRKLEYLALAEKNAKRLTQVLGSMPEGVAPIGSYLRDPGSYVTSVTSEYGQLDRLNRAIDQVRETRNQLSMLE